MGNTFAVPTLQYGTVGARRPARVVGAAESITGRAALDRHAGELADLLDAVAAPATARWAALSARLALRPRLVPWVTIIRRDGQVVAAALLTRQDVGLGHVVASMNEAHLPGCLPARDADAAADLAAAVVERLAALRRPWRLSLNTLGGERAESTVLRTLAAALEPCVVDIVARSPRLEFAPGEALNTYLSRNTRSARAKARNRIAGAGLELRLEWHHRPADVERQLADVVTVCRSRDRQSGQNRQLDKPGPRAMYLDQIRAYAADGRARLLTLRLGDALAAFAVCLLSDDMLYVHSNRAAPEWLAYSPGLIVNAEVVDHAYADPGLRGVDWGGSPQRFKMSGGARLHEYVTLSAWSGTAARGVDAAALRARIGAAGLLRRARPALTAVYHGRTDHV